MYIFIVFSFYCTFSLRYDHFHIVDVCRFIYVLAPHIGDVISDVLYDALQDWQIENKMSTVTLDKCTNNDNVVYNEGDDLVFSLFDKFLSEKPYESASYVRIEMNLYLEEPILPRTQELDIINWWEYVGIK
jgi:hypothetical protein